MWFSAQKTAKLTKLQFSTLTKKINIKFAIKISLKDRSDHAIILVPFAINVDIKIESYHYYERLESGLITFMLKQTKKFANVFYLKKHQF